MKFEAMMIDRNNELEMLNTELQGKKLDAIQ